MGRGCGKFANPGPQWEPREWNQRDEENQRPHGGRELGLAVAHAPSGQEESALPTHLAVGVPRAELGKEAAAY